MVGEMGERGTIFLHGCHECHESTPLPGLRAAAAYGVLRLLGLFLPWSHRSRYVVRITHIPPVPPWPHSHGIIIFHHPHTHVGIMVDHIWIFQEYIFQFDLIFQIRTVFSHPSKKEKISIYQKQNVTVFLSFLLFLHPGNTAIKKLA